MSSGGDLRTQLARALAQEPSELLFDEPTSHLDIQHQLDLLKLITNLSVTTVIALHDLNLAAMYCDRLLVLREGRGYALRSPAPSLMEEIHRVRTEVTPDPERAVIRFLRRGT